MPAESTNAGPLPRASVLIPTAGRPSLLAGALASVRSCGEDDVEIVVIDNDADGLNSDRIRSICASIDPAIRYVFEPSPGQTAARHRGAREARGSILIYIDDDVRVTTGWLNALLGAFDDPDVGLAGGPSIPLFTGSVPAWLWDFIQPTPFGGWSCGWLSLLDIGRDVRGIDPLWIWGLNFAVRRDVLSRAGGFNPDLVPSDMQRWQGDGESGLAIRVKEAGIVCCYAEAALLHHAIGPDRLTSTYFARRAYYQGVCDSFTRIRGGDEPSAEMKGPRTAPSPDGATPWARAAYEIRCETVRAYNDGWTFHQRETARDPSLLEWVRRPDFRDADIRHQVEKGRA